MKVLILGGTLFMGIHLVNQLLEYGHDVTIATRGNQQDSFDEKVSRLIIERTDIDSMKKAFGRKMFDVVYDNIALSSNAVRTFMEIISPPRYIMISTMSVYTDYHSSIKEEEFDPYDYELKWCDRQDYPYAEAKRQAECALYQKYASIPSAAVRFPFVTGADDYTKRLEFYVDNTINGKPMHIDNIDQKLGFIDSHDAGYFLAWLCARNNVFGCVNASSAGNISMKEILDYITSKTKKIPILSSDGLKAPYNGFPEYSLDTSVAEKCGYQFSDINDWIYSLLDIYMNNARKRK